jgi:hypothetical protein
MVRRLLALSSTLAVIGFGSLVVPAEALVLCINSAGIVLAKAGLGWRAVERTFEGRAHVNDLSL